MLKQFKLACALGSLAMVALLAQPAAAVPVTYIFSGTGSGTGTDNVPSFQDDTFTFTITTDTSLIDTSGAPYYRLDNVSGTFTQGSFTGTLDATLHIVATADSSFPRINLFDAAADNGVGINDPSLSAYDLFSSFGPLTVSSATLTSYLIPTIPGDPSSVPGFTFDGGGSIVITDNTSLTFTAIVRGTDVPEPITLTLFAAGIAGIGAVRRRK
ncbi:MAG TPA: PEP-CTERM sorting domain-containing protein [Rhizomicrobium sp.]|nr:PEP-CTERM sorting domain-containing protein [Rhizomicrobium sp.]